MEVYLIPKLERLYGPNHRWVHRALRLAKERREAEQEEVSREMRLFFELVDFPPRSADAPRR